MFSKMVCNEPVAPRVTEMSSRQKITFGTFSEELRTESGSWSSELSQVGSRQEKLLGDVFRLAVNICILPPFGPKSRFEIINTALNKFPKWWSHCP